MPHSERRNREREFSALGPDFQPMLCAFEGDLNGRLDVEFSGVVGRARRALRQNAGAESPGIAAQTTRKGRLVEPHIGEGAQGA